MADAAASSGMGALLSTAQSGSGGLAKVSSSDSNPDVTDGNTSTFSTVLAEQSEPVADLDVTRRVTDVTEVFSAENPLVKVDAALVEALDGGEMLPVSGNALPVVVDEVTNAELAGLIASTDLAAGSDDSLNLDTTTPEQSSMIDPSLLQQLADVLQPLTVAKFASGEAEDKAESDSERATSESALLALDGSGLLSALPVVVAPGVNNQPVSADVDAGTGLSTSQSASSGIDLVAMFERKAKVGESSKPIGDGSLDTVLDLDNDLSFKDSIFSKITKPDVVFNLKDNFNNPLTKAIELTSLNSANSSTSLEINALPSWRQQGVDSYTAVQPGSTALSVNVPVAKPGWGEAVLDKVMWMSSQKMDSADIALDPADLGPMHVRISTHHDQTSIVFTSQHAQVREALDQASGHLRQSLENQGFGQVNVDVSGQNAGQQLASQAQSDGSGNRSADADVNPDDQSGSIERPAAIMTSVNKLGLVDTFV